MTTTLKSFTHDDPERDTTAHSKLWWELFKLSDRVIGWYHTDRYHDAVWINEHARKPCTFFYSTRDTGTNIGFDVEYVAYTFEHLYVVKIQEPTHDEGGGWRSWKWTTKISELGT